MFNTRMLSMTTTTKQLQQETFENTERGHSIDKRTQSQDSLQWYHVQTVMCAQRYIQRHWSPLTVTSTTFRNQNVEFKKKTSEEISLPVAHYGCSVKSVCVIGTASYLPPQLRTFNLLNIYLWHHYKACSRGLARLLFALAMVSFQFKRVQFSYASIPPCRKQGLKEANQFCLLAWCNLYFTISLMILLRVKIAVEGMIIKLIS